MTNEQRQKIVALSLASRKASEEYGRSFESAPGDYKWACRLQQEAEDAYATLMSAIFDATEVDERSNEWIEEPGQLQNAK